MSYNTKNYTEQGGEVTVIGGVLKIAAGGKIVNDAGALLIENQAASVEASYPTVTEFNALIAKLKAAGLMVEDL
jgi:hypothetical protein